MTIATPFAQRVAGVFATRVVRFVLGFATSFLLARVLGPGGRGAYYLVSLTPTTLQTIAQFGLPSAMSFFAGRGRSTRKLQAIALVLAIGLSVTLLLATLAVLPWLEETILKAAPDDPAATGALFSLPFQFLASFAGAILIGRQVMRNYNLILVGVSITTLVLIVLLVGVLRLGVFGAVLANLIVAGAAAVATMNELRRLNREEPRADARPSIRVAELLSYGLKIYPASITSFFSYRADVFTHERAAGRSAPDRALQPGGEHGRAHVLRPGLGEHRLLPAHRGIGAPGGRYHGAGRHALHGSHHISVGDRAHPGGLRGGLPDRPELLGQYSRLPDHHARHRCPLHLQDPLELRWRARHAAARRARIRRGPGPERRGQPHPDSDLRLRRRLDRLPDLVLGTCADAGDDRVAPLRAARPELRDPDPR